MKKYMWHAIIKKPLNHYFFTGKHLCHSLFFNKVSGVSFATLLKKILWHRCFPINFEKFLRTPFLIEAACISLKIIFRSEAVTWRCSAKKLFLEVLQKSQEPPKSLFNKGAGCFCSLESVRNNLGWIFSELSVAIS